MGRIEIVDEGGCCSIYDFDWDGWMEWLKKNLPGFDEDGSEGPGPDDYKNDIKTEAIEQYGSDCDAITTFLEEVIEPTLPDNEGFIVRYMDEKDEFEILHIRVGDDKNKPKKKR
jgi:hypothetical protein